MLERKTKVIILGPSRKITIKYQRNRHVKTTSEKKKSRRLLTHVVIKSTILRVREFWFIPSPIFIIRQI